MNKGGGGTQQTTSRVELPTWLDNFAQNTLNMAGQVADRPYQGYDGQRVAGMTGDQLQAQQGIRDVQGATSGFQNTLASGAANLAGYQPQEVAGRTMGSVDLGAYMNPFLSGVESYGLNAIENQRLNAENALADRAISSRAFGGSRLAIQNALNDQNAMQAAGQLSAGLRSQGFQQAQQTAQADLNRLFQTDVTNQQAGLAGQQAALQALGMAGGLAGNAQRSAYTDLAALDASGGQQQGMQQAALDDAYSRFQQAQAYPAQQLGIRLQALGGTPYGQTTTQTSPVSGGNPAMGALGGALAGGQLAAMGGFGGPVGMVLGGLTGLLGSR